MLEKAVCDSDRVEGDILRGIFITGKRVSDVRIRHFSVIFRKNIQNMVVTLLIND